MIHELDIAIIGMACRFPGADSVAEFWENLRDGVESVSVFSDAELLAAGVDPVLLQNPNYVKAGTIITDADCFDAQFFGFTPREATLLDPQHRLFLECAQTALEDAGYDSTTYQGAIGVYAGTGANIYLLNNLRANQQVMDHAEAFQNMIANDKDFLPTQLSYRLDLKGPSVTIQTACSTSLVAVHLACQSLLNGECHMALAGGVSIRFPQGQGYLYQEGMILSPDGHCRAFDAQAQGTVSGGGVGLVVLKRAEEALADGDCIYALIKGTAINNDGATKVNYTAPSVDGQARVIREAQRMAGVAAETISYIEAHGTGTLLGDPIEIAALTQAFQSEKRSFCAIGSVKTNIGHANTAAGVAGLIKTVLALKHRLIPPSLHFTAPNPQIDFANSPFYVNNRLAEWQTVVDQPRRAGVSSFGIGGTNAHVILEEAPQPTTTDDPLVSLTHTNHLLVLSAKTETALATATANLAEYLALHPGLDLADVAYTLQVGRSRHPYRRMWVGQTLADAVRALQTPQCLSYEHQPLTHCPTVFLFPGGGAQYRGMGADLYTEYAVFRQAIDQCASWLYPRLGLDIRQWLYHSNQKQTTVEDFERATLALPILFATEYALARLLIHWGIHPQAMIGHSLGEYVAACLAGVFSLEDALSLVLKRGQLFDELPGGAMLSVALSAEALQGYLTDDLSLAAINTPEISVVSGPTAAIAELAQTLTVAEIANRHIHIAVAAHSSMLAPILERFHAFVRTIPLHPPQIPFVSNVTGQWISVEQATDPIYWVNHLRQTVRFADGVATLLELENVIFLEIGPGRTLTTLINQHPTHQHPKTLATMRHPYETLSDVACLLTAFGQLWLAGCAIHWANLYQAEQRRRLPLPTYPFERQRYWLEPATAHITSLEKSTKATLTKKPDMADWFYIPSWKRALLPVVGTGNLTFSQSNCWLIFVDECGLGVQVAKRLAGAGQLVITVHAGATFHQDAENAYTLNPQSKEEYETLIQTLLAQGKQPQIVLHLWRVTAQPGSLNDASLAADLDLGFYSLLFLTQVLGSITESLTLLVITNHLHEVSGDEAIVPGKATVLGPVNVIPQEYPNFTCCSIDIQLPTATELMPSSLLVEQLLAEFHLHLSNAAGKQRSNKRPPIVAYRGKYRWMQTYQSLRLEEPTQPNRLREKGVYLITGGLGGIGLTLAAYLATFQAKLILISRTVFPPRQAWAEWLATHDEHDAVSQKICKLKELEALGAEILVMRADVSIYTDMQAVVTEGTTRFGPINGVIHTAGVPGGGVIQRKTIPTAAAVLAPKVQGTLVLHTLFQNADLDFFVLCSSLNAILGSFAHVEYTAANAFLDAYSFHRHAGHTVSINWDIWQEVGMGVNIPIPQQIQATHKARLLQGILPEEGQKLFNIILHANVPQVAIITSDLPASTAAPHAVFNGDHVAPPLPAEGTHVIVGNRPALSTPYMAPQRQVEQLVVEIYQNVLGIKQIGIEDDFFELGGHSLTATQVTSRLQKTFGINIALPALFDHPTVAQLANYIDLRLTAQQGVQQVQAFTQDDVEELEEGEV